MLEPQMTCPPGVSFDQESHTYMMDGAPAPSVSALLNVVDPDVYAGIREDIMREAAERGSNCHDMIALDVRGDLDVTSLSGHLVEDYLAWDDFREKFQFEAAHSERVVASRRHRYCGTLDLAGTLVYKGSRGNWLVDIKRTAARPGLVDIQTEAYKVAAVETLGLPEDIRRGCLWIKRNGTFDFFELSNKSDRAVLLAARTIYQRRHQ